MTPKVSVVIPTFNRAALIVNALKSVFAQTYQDYEIIVVDDGSTDGTQEILKPYSQRIRYVYQENRGASAAQNKGIEFAKGEWISILASDDEWLPTKLERQFLALAETGGGSQACFTDCTFVGNTDFSQTAFELGGFTEHGRSVGILNNTLHYVLARHAIIYVQSLLVRKPLIAELGGFDEAMIVSEDTDLLLRLALRTTFCFVAEPLVRIDRTPSTPRLVDLFSQKSESVFSSRERMFRKWLNLAELVDPQARKQITESLVDLFADRTILKLGQFRFVEALSQFRKAAAAGGSYFRILSTIAFRAARKLLATLKPEHSSAEG
jgi:glycosyltransferase involved in cell wall biosynthesis